MYRQLFVGALIGLSTITGCHKTKPTTIPAKPPVVIMDLVELSKVTSIKNGQYSDVGYAVVCCERPIMLTEHDNGLVLQAAAPPNTEWSKLEQELMFPRRYKKEQVDFFDNELKAEVFYDPERLAPEGYEDSHTFHFYFLEREKGL